MAEGCDEKEIVMTCARLTLTEHDNRTLAEARTNLAMRNGKRC